MARCPPPHPVSPDMKRTTILILFLVLPILLLTAASSSPPPPMDSDSGTDAEHYLSRFVKPSVSPREDFFQYAVGKWLDENPIPATERSWGIAHVVQEETYRRVRSISDNAA